VQSVSASHLGVAAEARATDNEGHVTGSAAAFETGLDDDAGCWFSLCCDVPVCRCSKWVMFASLHSYNSSATRAFSALTCFSCTSNCGP
jgi:hypothetical protein